MALNLDDKSRERMLEWKAVADQRAGEILVLGNRLYEQTETADRRLALLRREHEDAKTHGHCAFCKMEPEDFSVALFITLSWKHADGCELAAELATEE